MIDDIKGYIIELEKKLADRQLDNFWVMSDNEDFKPIKNISKAEIRKKLSKKPQYYRGKHIAEVDVWTDPKRVDTDDYVMSIKVMIFEIGENGEIDKKYYNVWGIRLNFMTEDFKKIKFSLKLVEALMRLANDKSYINETLNGTSYKNFVSKLKKKKIPWDF